MEISNESSENHQNVQVQLIRHSFGLFIQHKWTLKSLEDTAKLMNSHYEASFNKTITKHFQYYCKATLPL